MEQFDTDETLIKNKKEKKKEKFPYKIIIFLSIVISLGLIFLFRYKNEQLNEQKNLLKNERQKNDDLREIIDLLNEERGQINKTLNELIKWKEENEKVIKEENDNIEFDIDSNIINRKNEIKLIVERLTNNGTLDINKITFNLVYRASRDGFGADNYHNKCDGKINTLCAIETTKGCKFGGYTETKIANNGENLKDPKSFLFSLNKMRIYENKNKENNVIRHYRGYGPYFVGGFITFDGHFHDNANYIYDNSSSSNFFSNADEEYEINNGYDMFKVRELEIFEIILE